MDKAQLLTGGPTAITAEAEARRADVGRAFAVLLAAAREIDPSIPESEVRARLCGLRSELRPD